MAIGLKDLKKKKKLPASHASEDASPVTSSQKTKALRPWQTETSEFQSFKYSQSQALKAIEKAREISKKNEEFSHSLRSLAENAFPDTCQDLSNKDPVLTDQEVDRAFIEKLGPERSFFPAKSKNSKGVISRFLDNFLNS
jgi:hypothetical protein